LAFENIAHDVPKKLKEQSVSQEKDITKKLYTDYSLFKRELHQDLVQQNPQFNALELFQKSQKLLDRFLFIFFAEDRNLLPTNLIFRINKEWRQLQEMRMNISLYDRYKIYFNDLNKGAKVTLPAFSETIALQKEEHQIFAYNGGLFQPDEILDHIRIDDELLYKYTHKLSNYDFASEVDVNILGHIFENSLNELDEIKAQLEGGSIDKQSTKRKKDGVFYTPKYITKYIVDNTIGKLCAEKKVELNIIEEDYISTMGFKPLAKKTKQPLLEKLTTYRNWLLKITICDPACGSGAFLNQALDFLIAEHGYIDELQAKLFGDGLILSDVEKSILENNLFGVDLNEESVEIAKFSLWLRTAQPNRKLNDLNNNIKCGNSLIDDVEVAGDKAFNWQTAFPKIFKKKNKKAFHITTAIHDSRTSQRMIDYKVREKRAMGTMPEPKINYLTDNDEMVIAETVAVLVKEQNLNILAFNICKDHIHIVLVCEEEEVDEIVRKIKGRTAREVNLNKGFKPLVQKEGEKSIPLWTQKFGCKEIVDENQLSNTIDYIKRNRAKHNLPGNSNKGFKLLIESIACSHEHAFREEYKGGFDVIIGNPPYGAFIDKISKDYYQKRFHTFQGNFEIYFFFIELISSILKPKGKIGFITPDTWINIPQAKKLREHILEAYGINNIVIFKNSVFEDASLNAIVFILTFKSQNDECEIVNFDSKIDNFSNVSNNTKIGFIENWRNSEDKQFQVLQNEVDILIIEKINSKSQVASNFTDVCQGIVPYSTEHLTKEEVKNRVYHSNQPLDENYGVWIQGRAINRYSLNITNNEYLNYGTWLHRARKFKYFFDDRILIQEITGGNPPRISAINYSGKLFHDPGIISCINISSINTKYLLALINSKLVSWYNIMTSPKGNRLTFPKILIGDIRKLPIIEATTEKQIEIIEKVDILLSLNKNLQEQSQKFQRTIQRKFFSTSNDKGFKPLVEIAGGKPLADALPKKLQDWYLLSYQEFIKEIGKKKVKLSLSQEAEWEDYFIEESKKALELKVTIDATDKAIDAMVYELYGLSEAEIEIVESSN
jgi:REP element-mobilizing transposase RayT